MSRRYDTNPDVHEVLLYSGAGKVRAARALDKEMASLQETIREHHEAQRVRDEEWSEASARSSRLMTYWLIACGLAGAIYLLLRGTP